MSETYKLASQIENLANALFRANADDKISPDELAEAVDSLKRGQKLLKSIVEGFEKPVKEILKTQESFVINNRKYFYKVTTKKVFDTDKAKVTLESLDYSLEDFTKLQQSKSLDFELIKAN
jgi:hypothetical protein